MALNHCKPLSVALALVAVALLGPAVSALAQLTHDAAETVECNGGCTIRHSPVCGADGITYQAPCLAVCQGVAVAAAGPCHMDDLSLLDDQSESEAPLPPIGSDGKLALSRAGQTPRPQPLSPSAMHKYKAEGFRLVGHAKASGNFKARQPTIVINPNGTPVKPPRQSGPRSLRRALRYDLSSGLLYVTDQDHHLLPQGLDLSGAFVATLDGTPTYKADADTAADAGAAAAAEGSLPAAASSSCRKLRYIIGSDDRWQVADTTSFPWRALGELISWEEGSEWVGLCSGALISADAVLTAGHCVHEGSGGGWSGKLVFSPGRNGDSFPYGSILYDSATTYACWANDGDVMCDMAVVKLAKPVSPDHGFLSLAASDLFKAEQITTAGYPGTKNSTLWAATCTAVDRNPRDQLIKNECDIEKGQSGSAAWNSAFAVRGIVSFATCYECAGPGSCCDPTSYFMQMTTERVADAREWAGLVDAANGASSGMGSSDGSAPASDVGQLLADLWAQLVSLFASNKQELQQ